ncbi:hypothetical protein LINPERHAP1_LOCUS24288 [Linum perenne]
MPPLSPPPP